MNTDHPDDLANILYSRLRTFNQDHIIIHKKKEDVVNMAVDWGIPIGAGIAFGLGALGTGIAQSKIGAAGAGTIAERPETFGLMVILVAIPETLVILGFVVAAMMMIMLV
jgi:V/A-type H+/Na+-transporting ATPase subunit K